MAGRAGRPRTRPGAGGRHRLFVVLAGLLALSLTFVFGMLVGRHWARSQPALAEQVKRPSPTARRALSDPEAERPQIQDKLTFYRTLTAPLGGGPAPAQREGTSREEAPRERPKAQGEAPGAAPDGRSNASPGSPLESGGGSGAPAKAATPPQGPSQADGQPAPERYTVQVGAYRARRPAEELQLRLRNAGFEAFVAAVSGADGRVTHRVRVGSFRTRGGAEEVAERLRSQHALASFVTTR
jgi:cell division septation protein DedD